MNCARPATGCRCSSTTGARAAATGRCAAATVTPNWAGRRQDCHFDDGLYINPGPWRIPHHHRNLLHYCKLLGVRLEPFIQVNYNAYLHGQKAFGGKPQRYRAIDADYRGGISELLAKAVNQGALDAPLNPEDRQALLASSAPPVHWMRKHRYVRGEISSGVAASTRTPAAVSAAGPCRRNRSTRVNCLRRDCGSAAVRHRSTTCSPRCSSRSAAWAASARPSGDNWMA